MITPDRLKEIETQMNDLFENHVNGLNKDEISWNRDTRSRIPNTVKLRARIVEGDIINWSDIEPELYDILKNEGGDIIEIHYLEFTQQIKDPNDIYAAPKYGLYVTYSIFKSLSNSKQKRDPLDRY